MIWQELAVALIVGFAVVSLFRHLRGLLASAVPGAQPSCHGCDECEDEPAPPLVTLGATPESRR